MKKANFLSLLFAVMFLVMSGFGIIIPVLPFLAEEVGATPTQLGLLMATYSLMQLLFAPFWGQISDRYGRKPILFIGIAGLSLSFFLFAVSKTLTMLFIARIIGGMLSAATIPTAMAYVADVTTPQERGKAMGAIGAATGLGFIFGPAIGGIFSKINLHIPFFISGTLSAVTACLVLLFLKESLTKEKQPATLKTKEPIWYILKGPLLFLYLLQWLITFSLAGLEATFAYYAAKRAELYSSQLGYIFMIMGLASAIVQGGLIGKLIQKFGEGRVIQGGIIVSAVGFALILFVHNFLTAAIFLSIFGIGNGVIRPCVSSLVTKHISSGQGRATGLLSSFDSLGRIIGPPIAGQMFTTMIELPYLAGIVLSCFALILYHVFAKQSQQVSS
ncbi:MFS transporter [Parageobacillus toebii NBRC 107807]|uniref:Multidrug resistance protein n=1 Tax=Parageobacillus toebii NBRC 107807 TaxID=1223503 RepID=A0A6G9J4N9_9BACL|nr:MFS transporter [Parageobacillus toebii]MBB3869442.1 multidrug resistance protein [Parageobacillus toebii NBRC 107807]QIQ33673.1 MFS transporter [Parageobacillus toebii NBRC 107807]